MKEKIRFFYGIEVEEREKIFFEDLDAKNNAYNPGNFTIEGGQFLHFPVSFLNKLTFDAAKSKGLSQICDGIAFETTKNCWILVEIKTTISFDMYQKAINQLFASYLKAQTLLNVITPVENIQVSFFVIGSFKENDNEDDTMNAKEGDLNVHEKVYQSYLQLKKYKKTKLDIPHYTFLAEKVHLNYHRKKVKISHFVENSTCLFNI